MWTCPPAECTKEVLDQQRSANRSASDTREAPAKTQAAESRSAVNRKEGGIFFLAVWTNAPAPGSCLRLNSLIPEEGCCFGNQRGRQPLAPSLSLSQTPKNGPLLHRPPPPAPPKVERARETSGTGSDPRICTCASGALSPNPLEICLVSAKIDTPGARSFGGDIEGNNLQVLRDCSSKLAVPKTNQEKSGVFKKSVVLTGKIPNLFIDRQNPAVDFSYTSRLRGEQMGPVAW